MHLITSNQEDAFVHSKTLFVKSKIICTLFTSLKSFATDMESIDIFKSYTVLFHFSMHHVRGTTTQATAIMNLSVIKKYPASEIVNKINKQLCEPTKCFSELFHMYSK